MSSPGSAHYSGEEIALKVLENYRGGGFFGVYRIGGERMGIVRGALKNFFSKALSQPGHVPTLRLVCDSARPDPAVPEQFNLVKLAQSIEKDQSLSCLHQEAREPEDAVKNLVLAQRPRPAKTR